MNNKDTNLRMRNLKKSFQEWLESDNWKENLDSIASFENKAVSPLFSFLARGSELKHRAAIALGKTVARINNHSHENAQNICRRFLWHMNEDSGNIGWGIPEAFADTLAESPDLAKIYANILNSYIMDLGIADNYVENDQLRRSCFWAIGRLAQRMPDLVEKARPWIVKGLRDKDAICQGNAAWALKQLGTTLMDAPALRKLAKSNNNEICEIFENEVLRKVPANQLAEEALA